jgi:glycosyltransferase involved in cell wall biosynthesis
MPNQPQITGRHILHICSDFPNQHVYPNLVASIAATGQRQFVFSAVRSDAEAQRQPPNGDSQIDYSFQNIIRKRHRFLFRNKIDTARKALLKVTEPRKFDLVHAHFLYSDGALALQLKKQFGVPFITAVRNTDLNSFMRLRPDLWPIAKQVLTEASAVIFLSPAYQSATLARIGNAFASSVGSKSFVIPSGLPASWLDNPPPNPQATKGDIRVLYVGDFSRNKNIASIVRAVELLRSRTQAELTIVGGGGDGEQAIEAMLALPQYSFVTRLQPVRDAGRLREIYQQHTVFAMPSFRETFGIVYLEALSQGLPIIHSRGQGIDGLFAPNSVSEGVDPHSDTSLADAITCLAGRDPSIRKLCVSEANRFSWDSVAHMYARLYGSVSTGNTLETSC